MTFAKKIFCVSMLIITIILTNGCNQQPPEYFNELKETDLLIYEKKVIHNHSNNNTNKEKIGKEIENSDTIN